MRLLRGVTVTTVAALVVSATPAQAESNAMDTLRTDLQALLPSSQVAYPVQPKELLDGSKRLSRILGVSALVYDTVESAAGDIRFESEGIAADRYRTLPEIVGSNADYAFPRVAYFKLREGTVADAMRWDGPASRYSGVVFTGTRKPRQAFLPIGRKRYAKITYKASATTRRQVIKAARYMRKAGPSMMAASKKYNRQYAPEIAGWQLVLSLNGLMPLIRQDDTNWQINKEPLAETLQTYAKSLATMTNLTASYADTCMTISGSRSVVLRLDLAAERVTSFEYGTC